MKIKNLLAVVLGSLIVFALSLPIMAQSTTEATTSTTTTQEPHPPRPRAPPPRLRRTRQPASPDHENDHSTTKYNTHTR